MHLSEATRYSALDNAIRRLGVRRCGRGLVPPEGPDRRVEESGRDVPDSAQALSCAFSAEGGVFLGYLPGSFHGPRRALDQQADLGAWPDGQQPGCEAVLPGPEDGGDPYCSRCLIARLARLAGSYGSAWLG